MCIRDRDKGSRSTQDLLLQQMQFQNKTMQILNDTLHHVNLNFVTLERTLATLVKYENENIIGHLENYLTSETNSFISQANILRIDISEIQQAVLFARNSLLHPSILHPQEVCIFCKLPYHRSISFQCL